jgi:uncharacterized protein YdcH (DUF465 family)
MPEKNIELLVEKYTAQDPELKILWDEHVLFKKQIAKIESKAYRTPGEEQELRVLKKQKLEGKTRLYAKLEKFE